MVSTKVLNSLFRPALYSDTFFLLLTISNRWELLIFTVGIDVTRKFTPYYSGSYFPVQVGSVECYVILNFTLLYIDHLEMLHTNIILVLS